MSKEFFSPIIINDKYGNPIRAMTEGQSRLVDAIDKYDILFVNGPSGIGKTFLSICKAVVGLESNTYKRLVLSRPAVETGEDLGFIPGSINEKIAPYMKPLFDCIDKLKHKKDKPTQVDLTPPQSSGKGKRPKKKASKEIPHKQKDTGDVITNSWDDRIEISPLAYMRGLSLTESFVVIDEAQNITASQMKMLLTRIGNKSKLVINGDISQSDLKSHIKSGFQHAQEILQGVNGIGFITLTKDDIVRSKIIKDIIMRYENIE